MAARSMAAYPARRGIGAIRSSTAACLARPLVPHCEHRVYCQRVERQSSRGSQMATAQTLDLSVLYEQDETAWLEAMSALAAAGRYDEMDFAHLSEYLTDMARRDRREVFSRLVVLLTHLLKWEHQADRRSGSWRGTIREQRRELRQLLE